MGEELCAVAGGAAGVLAWAGILPVPGGEIRPQQLAMAEAVARALAGDRALAVEAGTGVGKSLAYLVPAVMHAKAEKRKAIISTHTINLQEQLLHKDLPLAAKLTGLEFTRRAFERPAELPLPAAAEGGAAPGPGSFHRRRGGGIAAHRGVGGGNDRRHPERPRVQPDAAGLGAGVQRAAPVLGAPLRAVGVFFPGSLAASRRRRTWWS